jgi:geranylgeranyl pyrophosphate synthase
MPAQRQADTSYIAEIFAFIERVLEDNLEEGALLDCLEAVFRAKEGTEETAPFMLLPIRVCQAAGGQAERAIGVSAAWFMLHTAALLLDDVEDGDLESKSWPLIRPSQAINAASALIVASQLALIRAGPHKQDHSLSRQLVSTFGHLVLRTCDGQHLDLSGQPFSLDDYWRMAAGKSGSFFELACRTGAMVAVDDPTVIDGYAEFGRNLGILLQICDDFSGVWKPSGRSDLVTGSRTLPLVYALSVADPETARHLLQLIEGAATDPPALSRAQQMLVDLGALQYVIVEAERFRRRSRAALVAQQGDSLALGWLKDLLDKMSPVPASIA